MQPAESDELYGMRWEVEITRYSTVLTHESANNVFFNVRCVIELYRLVFCAVPRWRIIFSLSETSPFSQCILHTF